MKTKLLLISSVIVMGLTGVAASFLPHEVLGAAGISATAPAPLMVQTCGALYLGFAMMNWMARGFLIGGIYARPIAMGNFTHFLIGALGLIKGAMANPDISVLWIAAALYTVFAAWYSLVLFTHPIKESA